jgi:chaperonin GroEL
MILTTECALVEEKEPASPAMPGGMPGGMGGMDY